MPEIKISFKHFKHIPPFVCELHFIRFCFGYYLIFNTLRPQNVIGCNAVDTMTQREKGLDFRRI